MTTQQNLANWPLKPNTKSAGTVRATNPSVRTAICRAELQDGLASRPWRVVLVNNSPGAVSFYVSFGDAYGASEVADGVTVRTLAVESVPGFGAPAAAPFVGNYWSLVVVGRSVSVSAAPAAPFAGNYDNVFAAVAPEGLSYPLLEP